MKTASTPKPEAKSSSKKEPFLAKASPSPSTKSASKRTAPTDAADDAAKKAAALAAINGGDADDNSEGKGEEGGFRGGGGREGATGKGGGTTSGGNGSGKGSGNGKGSGSGNGNSAEALAEYGGALGDRLKSVWDQPTVASGSVGGNLTATLHVRIEKDGRLSNASLSTASGVEVMDESVLATVNRVKRFDPLPPELAKKGYLELNIAFKRTAE